MYEVIAISNQKGGVGKSTTASALGAGLHCKGYKVLCIDLDAQGNLSYSMGVNGRNPTVLEVLNRMPIRETIQHTPQGDVIPSCPELATAETFLTMLGKEYYLREAIEPIRKEYDYILLDTPPSLGILTINALTASDSVIIPVQADIYSLQGLNQINQTIETVRRYCNPGLKIAGILATRYKGRNILTRDLTKTLEQSASELQTVLYKTRIRESVAIQEAQVMQKSIYDYAPKSKIAEDYLQFTEEFLKERKDERI